MGDLFSSFGDWLRDALLYVPRWFMHHLLDGLASLIEAIPVPDFIADWGDTVGGVASDVWWIASLFAVQEGFLIITSAYLLRFLIRRTPLVG